MSRRTESLEDSMGSVTEDMIYVAVGKDVKEGKAILLWALQNSGGKRICILHVHQPAQHIPFMGTRVPENSLNDEIVRQHQETERAKMHKLMDEYIIFCRQSGNSFLGMGWRSLLWERHQKRTIKVGAKTPISSVREEMATEAQEKRRQRTREIANQYILICGQRGAQAQKLLREGDCVKKEIVEVIRLHKIKHLVMGSELRRYCTRMDLKSEKARYVREKAPVFCLMHFVCRGNIIVVREASAETEPSSPTSVVDIECNYEEQDGSMFRTHSSALRSSSIERSLDIGTLCRTIQQVMTEFPERRGHMGQEAEEEIRGRWEELKELVQRLTEAALKREKEVHEIRSQFAALQDKVDELQVERDNLLTEVQGRMLG